MLQELVELGKRIYKGHDALTIEKCNWDIVIDEQGNFVKLIPCDISIMAEKLPAKKGRARLLLDKAEATLGFGIVKENDGKEDKDPNVKKHCTYLEKLNIYADVDELAPVFAFYKNPNGISAALAEYERLPNSQQNGNLTFMIGNRRVLNMDSVLNAIKRKYEEELSLKVPDTSQVCSICGTNKYPIIDESHGSVKMPKGQTSGSMLVSYNTNAFESYNLKGNENSCICTNCARNYIEALSYLTTNGNETIDEKTGEPHFKYTNRQKISDDTIALFWTKMPGEDIDPFSDICQPTEERITKLFSAIATGDSQRIDTDVENFFYCCTMSSAAARIAVRDWMAISISQYQRNITQWFEDIATTDTNGNTYYPGINMLLNNCLKRKRKPTQSDFKAKARIGAMLWHSALTNTPLPVMILQSVLTQIEHDFFTAEKSTVIRLILNRNNKQRYYMKEILDDKNESKAYLCGRLFALVCKQQYLAQGAVNNSIKDRFFASASTAPVRVMSLLLTKYVPIYEKKTKGAYTKSIKELAARIGHFSDKFTIAERGEFALGYYYQFNTKESETTNE